MEKESEALDEDRDSVVNNMHEITQLRYQRCRFARRHYATRSLVLDYVSIPLFPREKERERERNYGIIIAGLHTVTQAASL